MRDDTKVNGDMPWQVRAIGIFGVPSVIAMFLVYTMASNIGPLTNSIDALTAEVRQTNTQARAEYMAMRRLLTANCLNGAQNQEEQRRCLD